MKKTLKVIKWLAKSIGVLVGLIIVAGLSVRLFAPPPQAPGKLVDVGGFKLHINSTGEKNDKPTLLIEAGAGAPGEYYHWLSEGLKDHIRVVRYDRAGIGYSELAPTPRHPETVAKELHKLLELAGESPPYIMAGHSYGGHYIRIFTDLYPDEVAAMVFLDSSHPDASKRLNLPEEPWFLSAMYHICAVLGDAGILHIFDRTFGPILWAPGLPEEVLNRMKDYSFTGKFIKGYLRGDDKWGSKLNEMSSEANDFGSLPIQVFSGTHLNEKVLIRMGLDPEKIRAGREEMQQEIADLSTEGELFFLDAGHVTIFTKKEHADFICNHILKLLARL
ncbi:MAG: alpha/beta hydrolase [Bacteroidota bacterium]